MIIEINTQSEVPIYTQLTNQLIGLIARGIIKKGATLPSVRSLAADLGMNMHTVNKAYHELERRGIISIIPKSGAVILHTPANGIDSTHKQRIREQLEPILAEAHILGMTNVDIRQLIATLSQDFEEDE